MRVVNIVVIVGYIEGGYVNPPLHIEIVVIRVVYIIVIVGYIVEYTLTSMIAR